jgi:hypothetical protein
MRVWWRAMVTLGTVFAVVAVAAWRGGIAMAETEPAPRFTASEIVDAVVFNTGPAARYLTFPRPAMEWTESIHELRQGVQLAVHADNELDATLADQMQSGDPRRVDEGLARIADKVRTVLDAMFGTEDVDAAMTRYEEFFSKVDLLADARVLDHEVNIDNGQGRFFYQNKNFYENEDAFLNTDFFIARVAMVVVADAEAAIMLVAFIGQLSPLGGQPHSDATKLVRELMVRDIATGIQAPGR